MATRCAWTALQMRFLLKELLLLPVLLLPFSFSFLLFFFFKKKTPLSFCGGRGAFALFKDLVYRVITLLSYSSHYKRHKRYKLLIRIRLCILSLFNAATLMPNLKNQYFQG